MLMRPWAWCRDHTYTVIWTEHGQRERRGEPHLSGGAQSECGQASHCVQGCRGEHYAVVRVSFRKGQGWELSGTIEYNYCCRRRSITYDDLEPCSSWNLESPWLCWDPINWSMEGKVRNFVDVEKCAEPWIMIQQVRLTPVSLDLYYNIHDLFSHARIINASEVKLA